MYGVKMTMHINEALLERVMESHGFASKTEAVDSALREMDRKARFREFVSKDSGFSAEELTDAVDSSYDVLPMRVAEPSGSYAKRKTIKRSR